MYCYLCRTSRRRKHDCLTPVKSQGYTPYRLFRTLSDKQKKIIADKHRDAMPKDGGGPDLQSWKAFVIHLIQDETGTVVKWNTTQLDKFMRYIWGEK